MIKQLKKSTFIIQKHLYLRIKRIKHHKRFSLFIYDVTKAQLHFQMCSETCLIKLQKNKNKEIVWLN